MAEDKKKLAATYMGLMVRILHFSLLSFLFHMKPEPRRIPHHQPNLWARIEEISDNTDDRERS
jgi:hypothetical protein